MTSVFVNFNILELLVGLYIQSFHGGNEMCGCTEVCICICYCCKVLGVFFCISLLVTVSKYSYREVSIKLVCTF